MFQVGPQGISFQGIPSQYSLGIIIPRGKKKSSFALPSAGTEINILYTAGNQGQVLPVRIHQAFPPVGFILWKKIKEKGDVIFGKSGIHGSLSVQFNIFLRVEKFQFIGRFAPTEWGI